MGTHAVARENFMLRMATMLATIVIAAPATGAEAPRPLTVGGSGSGELLSPTDIDLWSIDLKQGAPPPQPTRYE